MYDSTEYPTAIEFRLEFFPMAFFLYFCTPVAEINGRPTKLRWGNQHLDVHPGEYTVKIYFAYLFLSQCAANSVSFVLEPGETKLVNFYVLPWMFAKGRISAY